MANSTNNNSNDASFEEKFFRQLIQNYQDAWNHYNEKYEIKFEATCTTHKVATKDGNQDYGYLRLTRLLREKEDPNFSTLKPNDWSPLLIHQEAYEFKDMKDQLNPKWREQIFMNAIARLVAGGLEYAELLKKMKQIEEGKAKSVEQKLDDLGLVKADAQPSPLSKEDQEYVEHIKREKAKNGQG